MKKISQEVSRYMSKIAKKSHIKSPRNRSHFVNMGIESGKARKLKKLSTGTSLTE